MVGLYKIESPSGNIYIGQSKDIIKRWGRYKDINSAQRQPAVLRSFEKYGIRNHTFSVLHELPFDVSQEVLDAYEIFYIAQYKECGIKLLNLKEGGLFGGHSDESKKKIGASKIGNKNRLGKSHSNETKDKISKSKKGKSPAWNKGIAWSDGVKEKMYKFPKVGIPWNKNKQWSDEAKQKMRVAKLGKIASEATKQKMRQSQKKRRQKLII